MMHGLLRVHLTCHHVSVARDSDMSQTRSITFLSFTVKYHALQSVATQLLKRLWCAGGAWSMLHHDHDHALDGVWKVTRCVSGLNDCLALTDEVDAIGAKRYESQSGGEREIQRTMLELLNQMDGFDARGDVKVLRCSLPPHI